MASLKFRITHLLLDGEEDVTGLTACVSLETYEVITAMIGRVKTTSCGRRADGTIEYTIVLRYLEARDLFHACGRLKGTDPRDGQGGNAVYMSLARVVQNWMGEE